MKKGLFTAVAAALALTLCTPVAVNAANTSPSGTIVPTPVEEAAGIKEGMTVKEAEAVVGALDAGEDATVSYVAKLDVVGGTEAAPKTVTPADFDPTATYIVVLDKAGKVIAKGTSVTLDPAKAAYIFTLTPGQHGGDATDKSIPVYRVYNPNSGEHHYTLNKGEADKLASLGWQAEGIGWYAPETGRPVYRLYNPNNGGEHHYTMNAGERDALKKAGWTYENIGWFSDTAERTPVYRQYNPNAIVNNHNYTANAGEKNALIKLGWKDEKIGWYAVKWK